MTWLFYTQSTSTVISERYKTDIRRDRQRRDKDTLRDRDKKLETETLGQQTLEWRDRNKRHTLIKDGDAGKTDRDKTRH